MHLLVRDKRWNKTDQYDEKYNTLQDYIDDMVRQGYIAEDGTPLKCYCGCTDFEEYDQYYEEFGICEYSLKCNKCGMTVGHWAYGHWDV